VNEALGRVRDAGTLDELKQKWLGGTAPVLE
jgi:ABC-type amino acid transport substrate-binding protein